MWISTFKKFIDENYLERNASYNIPKIKRNIYSDIKKTSGQQKNSGHKYFIYLYNSSLELKAPYVPSLDIQD